MKDDLAQFSWSVSSSGYEWREATGIAHGRHKAGDAKFVTVVTTGSREVRRYSVLESETGLFRTFASTEATESAILQFAERYGQLGGEVSQPFVDPLSELGWSSGETLGQWEAEITSMRRCIELWDLVRAKRVRELARVIRWRPDASGVAYVANSEVGARSDEWCAITTRDSDEPLLRMIPPGDVILPALLRVQRVVNEKLHEHGVRPMLLWDHPLRLNDLRLYVTPESLIGALWVQFAQAMDGVAEFGRCETCGRWFELTRGRRRGAKSCSDACRSRKYRKSLRERQEGGDSTL